MDSQVDFMPPAWLRETRPDLGFGGRGNSRVGSASIGDGFWHRLRRDSASWDLHCSRGWLSHFGAWWIAFADWWSNGSFRGHRRGNHRCSWIVGVVDGDDDG